jgi:antitoxin FitA
MNAIIDSIMAQLIVRQLDEELVFALKRRAARLGRSAEAEHREILREALAQELARPSFKRFLQEMPAVGEDSDFELPRDLPREPSL